MRILYFGTVCDLNHYQNMLDSCSDKPSIAPILFESALLEGMMENGAKIDIFSFPMIPTFPKFKRIFVKNISEKLPCGYKCTWLNTINLPFIKQASRCSHAKRIIRNWCKENKNNGTILTYSIPPFLVRAVTSLASKYSVKTVAIVPDLLRDMYINSVDSNTVSKIKNYYLNSAIKYQGNYDGYVYLTDEMHNVVAPDKPYTVVEGIANIKNIPQAKDKKTKAVMYAGMLNAKYGIMNLVDAFESIKDSDSQLWLFGAGNLVQTIKERANNNPKIKYFGQLNHNEIIEYESKATLLVNPRDPDDEFTHYSFPSKTIEYMLSGTPVLTTKLKGIPDEYFDYIFSTEGNSVQQLSESISRILKIQDNDLIEFGSKAKNFIIKEKNASNQASKIIHFIEGLYEG